MRQKVTIVDPPFHYLATFVKSLKHISRRSFLATTVGGSVAAGAYGSTRMRASREHFTILFQGDSITDGNRGRGEDPNHILGHGYAFAIASTLASKYPGRDLSFINKGVSGDKVSDLLARWDRDAVSLKPDVLSILVGINDLLANLGAENVTDFATPYRQLLTKTSNEMPGTVIVLCEPFILPVGMIHKNPDKWKRDIAHAQQVVKDLAVEFAAVHVPFQRMFDQACKQAAAGYWIWDGIHPTYAGHGLMARLWIKEVSTRCDKVVDR
ncbi:MAG TPA: SGNH/GDSL hydrolase family protein [Chryseosolibacter sp.]|nr:SGNH/GDSL hydrolase family protein [Chryseosolibacter sp.]